MDDVFEQYDRGLRDGGAAYDPDPSLAESLSIQAWAERDIPPPDRLLGDLVTTTSRIFLVGRTGLGKTMLGFGLAVGMAAGTGFLHWRSARPARVLYLDGEMPGELIKSRAIDALRRAGDHPPPPGKLVIFARDSEEEFARRYPTLPAFAPLNTAGGQNFLLALIAALGGVDVIIFDNVMSLISGDQKDELSWTETLPLVASLTSKRIGQIWLDHTGHATDRQYGSATKAWRFDAVGIMATPPSGQTNKDELAFTLSFEHPGKSRRRTPDNWHDFETCTVRLNADRWESECASGPSPLRRMSPMAAQFHGALLDALSIADVPGQTTRSGWYAECVRVGISEPLVAADTPAARRSKQASFRKYVSELRAAGLIGLRDGG